MFNRLTSAAILALAGAGTAQADCHAGLVAYALAGEGMTLVTMPSLAAPGDTMSVTLPNRLDAIAYRPVTGELLGFSAAGGL